jgi:hypothetical protein
MRAFDIIKTQMKDDKTASDFKKKVSSIYPDSTFFQESPQLTQESLKEAGNDAFWASVSSPFIDYLSPKLIYMQ